MIDKIPVQDLTILHDPVHRPDQDQQACEIKHGQAPRDPQPRLRKVDNIMLPQPRVKDRSKDKESPNDNDLDRQAAADDVAGPADLVVIVGVDELDGAP